MFRNHTKREHIREDQDMIGDFDGGIDRGMLFGKVLLAQICWSDDSFVLINYEGALHRSHGSEPVIDWTVWIWNALKEELHSQMLMMETRRDVHGRI